MYVVASGTWDSRDAISNIESGLPSGTPAMLEVSFPSRFIGFDTAASSLSASMNLAGVTPWSDGSPYVTVDPQRPVWYVRWTRNPLWAAVVWSLIRQVILIAVGLTLLAYVTWKFLIPVATRAVSAVIRYVLPYAAIGVSAYLIAKIMAGKPPGN